MTWHIHIQGQVQGVGFRPFVFLLAQEMRLRGNVKNTPNGVHIKVNAERSIVDQFISRMSDSPPKRSKITKTTINEIDEEQFNQFEIIHSSDTASASLLITPDIAICDQCLSDIDEKDNSRNGYPFTTCTNCGPRFSIISSLPYDREKTSMKSFVICSKCQDEYDDPYDRRYYSQTNSCPSCSIELKLFKGADPLTMNAQSEILDTVVDIWSSGGIVAIKGIGGYLLTCDANNKKTVQELRLRKQRPSKPFAIMMTSSQLTESGLVMNVEQVEAFESHVAPIVLVDFNSEKDYSVEMTSVTPNLSQVGVVKDYTPLYTLLLEQFGKPIIATSGNVSGSPIIYNDQVALERLSKVADYLLVNNRDIQIAQDDSLIKYSPFYNQKIILRRSRGMAPTYIPNYEIKDSNIILATGAHMKSSFCLAHNKNIFLSQYLGNLESYESMLNYENSIDHMLTLLNTKPEVILMDLHNEYGSTKYGEVKSEDLGLPSYRIQHHEAHFAAILGEFGRLDSSKPILGVIWDGTGAGTNNTLWGGEFFTYHNYQFDRSFHFDYFDQLAGDKMSREPRLSALSLVHNLGNDTEKVTSKFSRTELKIYEQVLTNGQSIQTSSVGRLFDAVSSIIGIVDKQSYEGEAAMRLEVMALEYFREHGLGMREGYVEELTDNKSIPTKSIISGVLYDLQNSCSKEFIAAKFHNSLVEVIKLVAIKKNVNQIAFSGGVFQNGLLLDLIKYQLQEKYQLLFHQEMSPNDENISFGQVMHYQIMRRKNSMFNSKNIEQCV